MIYLENNGELQTIAIPIGYTKTIGDTQLSLRSTLDLEETILDVADEKADGYYYIFNIALPAGMTDGEYAYKVIQGGKVMAEGMAVLKYAPQQIQQVDNDIKFEQYEG